jgi:hypothetical protein
MKIGTRLLLLFALCGAALAFGCGYRAGFLIPADIKSVHVKMPRNETFWREAAKRDNLVGGPVDKADTDAVAAVEDRAALVDELARPAQTIEVDLAERLKNEVVRRTPLKLADADRADSIIETTITRMEPAVLLRDPEDEVISQRVTVVVDFRWVERRTGRVIASGEGVSRPTDFTIARGEGLTTATRTSFDFIVKQIVERMQEDF